MKTGLWRTLILCGVSACPMTAGDPLRENPEVTSGIRLFEAWMEEQMVYRGLPGVAVGVVYDQDLVWARGFGYADVDRHTPVKPDTIFRMASNTKMFTATAILQLRDAGKIRLDDPVSKYLPWFHVKPAEEDDPPITIEHLLTHGSGLPREAVGPYWTTFRFPTKDEVERTLATEEAAYPPETRFKYSNLAFALAGYIAEAVSGEPYGAYVNRHILKPLGMLSSSIDFPPDQMVRLATGYGRRMPDGSRQHMPFTDCKGIAPAAALSSTVEDMARFVSLQLRPGAADDARILKSSTLREMHRVRFIENTWMRGYGLGFDVWRYQGKVYVGHGGSLAGYKTQTMIQLDDKVGVVVLTNGDDSHPDRIADRVMQWVGQAVAKAAKPPTKPSWDPSWRRFAGLYRSRGGDLQVIEMNDALVIIDPEVDDPEGAMLKLIPVAGGGFKLDGPTGGAAIGELVKFIEGPDGQVTGMTIGQQLSQRVAPGSGAAVPLAQVPGRARELHEHALGFDAHAHWVDRHFHLDGTPGSPPAMAGESEERNR